MNGPICITGGTGFVGRGVVGELLARGYRIHAVVRRGSESKLPVHPLLTLFRGDVLDAASLVPALTGCRALVHLAGIRRRDAERTGLSYEVVDLGSAVAAISAMRQAGVGRIVLLSAASVGASGYVQVKQKVEAAVRASGLVWTILKPSFILGPGQRWPIVLGPFLDLLALLPGRVGEQFGRARNVTLRQLARAIAWSLEAPTAIRTVMEVKEIREVPK